MMSKGGDLNGNADWRMACAELGKVRGKFCLLSMAWALMDDCG